MPTNIENEEGDNILDPYKIINQCKKLSKNNNIKILQIEKGLHDILVSDGIIDDKTTPLGIAMNFLLENL